MLRHTPEGLSTIPPFCSKKKLELVPHRCPAAPPLQPWLRFGAGSFALQDHCHYHGHVRGFGLLGGPQHALG